VSRALLVAEEKLGVRLFERTPRGLCPTVHGARLIDGAGMVLSQLLELEASARTRPSDLTHLRLVCECYTAYRWLPSTIVKLSKRLPALDVTLAVEHTHDPVSALVAGDIDVALLTTAKMRDAVRERPLFSDEIVFVVSASHPPAARPSITPRDLAEYTLITSNTPAAEQQWFMTRVFGRKKPKLRFSRFPLTEAIIDAARAGMGVAVLSEWIASVYLGTDDLVAKRLASEPLRRPWRIAFRPEAARAVDQLVSALEGSAPRVYA
jgi:LysR family transcriptional regulator for metE and metH